MTVGFMPINFTCTLMKLNLEKRINDCDGLAFHIGWFIMELMLKCNSLIQSDVEISNYLGNERIQILSA